MTRAFGYFCLKDFGVIAIPEITHRQLTNRDQFIVVASVQCIPKEVVLNAYMLGVM